MPKIVKHKSSAFVQWGDSAFFSKSKWSLFCMRRVTWMKHYSEIVLFWPVDTKGWCWSVKKTIGLMLNSCAALLRLWTFLPEANYNFITVIELPYCTCVFLVTNLSLSIIIFDLVTLTLKFDLLLKNFNLGHNLQTRTDRALIFHMSIYCDKTFHMVP